MSKLTPSSLARSSLGTSSAFKVGESGSIKSSQKGTCADQKLWLKSRISSSRKSSSVQPTTKVSSTQRCLITVSVYIHPSFTSLILLFTICVSRSFSRFCKSEVWKREEISCFNCSCCSWLCVTKSLRAYLFICNDIFRSAFSDSTCFICCSIWHIFYATVVLDWVCELLGIIDLRPSA